MLQDILGWKSICCSLNRSAGFFTGRHPEPSQKVNYTPNTWAPLHVLKCPDTPGRQSAIVGPSVSICILDFDVVVGSSQPLSADFWQIEHVILPSQPVCVHIGCLAKRISVGEDKQKKKVKTSRVCHCSIQDFIRLVQFLHIFLQCHLQLFISHILD